jgi:hypothetical protein
MRELMMTQTLLPFADLSKKCTRCGIEKPLGVFAVIGKTRRRASWCGPCAKAYAADHAKRNYRKYKKAADDRRRANPGYYAAKAHEKYIRNRDRIAVQTETYRLVHRDEIRAQQKEWREQNKELKAARDAAYAKKNRQKVSAKKLAWAHRNPDRVKASMLASYLREKDKWSARSKRWKDSHPDARRAMTQRRRAQKKVNGPHERFKDTEIFERDGWICQICREPVDRTIRHPDPKSASLDHIVPIVKRGLHVRSNVQLAHLGCNCRKHARLIDGNQRHDFALQPARECSSVGA